MKIRLLTGAFLPMTIAATMALTGCGSDDTSSADDGSGGNTKITQAILVYMNAENNLSSFATTDLAEMLEGSKSLKKNTAVYAFVDQADSSQKPYIKRFYQGEGTVLYTYDKDFIASDPTEMTKAIQKMIDLTEATNFSMILWGHGTGSLMTTDTVPTTTSTNIPSLQAYGYDSNNNTKSGKTNFWINTPALARVFSGLTTPTGDEMKFQTLFFDCCCMQNTENAYELRNNADYYVAVATETPSCGANYTTALLAFNKSGEDCAKAIVDAYVAQFPLSNSNYTSDGICIAAVRMNQMENLMKATRTALQTKYDGTPLYLSTSSTLKLESDSPKDCIYYAYTDQDLSASSSGMKILYDVKDIMRENITDENAYKAWLNVFNQTVFYTKHPEDTRTLDVGVYPWISELIASREWYRFYISDETCGCMNTTFPINPSTSSYPTEAKVLNKRHMQLQWWQKIWKNFGF